MRAASASMPVVGRVVYGEESVGNQELVIVANLTFKKGLRSQRAMETMEVKAVKGAELRRCRCGSVYSIAHVIMGTR